LLLTRASRWGPVECFNPNAAVMRAEALSLKEGHVGAVAFSRTLSGFGGITELLHLCD